MKYDYFWLISPLELSRTDAYKDISLFTECELNLQSHAQLSNASYAQPDSQLDVAEQYKVKITVKIEDE